MASRIDGLKQLKETNNRFEFKTIRVYVSRKTYEHEKPGEKRLLFSASGVVAKPLRPDGTCYGRCDAVWPFLPIVVHKLCASANASDPQDFDLHSMRSSLESRGLAKQSRR